MSYFWIMICVAMFFAGAHFGVYLQNQRTIDPHFLHGDDSELCMSHCNDQKIEDMQQALEIWNAANCSVRDICTPASINPHKCNCLAPQIQKCEPDDESVNITGFCDPDDSDDGNETDDNGGYRTQWLDKDPCFATQELADKYKQQYGNESGDVKVPCPPVKIPAEDESGK